MGVREYCAELRSLPQEWRDVRQILDAGTQAYTQLFLDQLAEDVQNPRTRHTAVIELGALLGMGCGTRTGAIIGGLVGPYAVSHMAAQSGSMTKTLLTLGMGALVGMCTYAAAGCVIGAGMGAASMSVAADAHEQGSWRAGLRRTYDRLDDFLHHRPSNF